MYMCICMYICIYKTTALQTSSFWKNVVDKVQINCF